MNNRGGYKFLIILAALIFVFLESLHAFGEQARPSGVMKEVVTVDFVDHARNKIIVDDHLMDIPPGVPYLRPGDVIEMRIDIKSGKVINVVKVGVDRDRHKPFAHSGDGTRTSSAFKGNNGKIRKVDGKWRNY